MSDNILIVIFDKKQIRSFLESNAFDKVIKTSGPKSRIIILNKLASYLKEDQNKILLPELPILLKRSGSLLGSSLLWRKRHQTIAHFRRAVFSFAPRKKRKENTYHILLDENSISELTRLFIRILSIKYLYTTLRYVRRFLVMRFLKKAFSDLNLKFGEYQAAFVPYSGQLSPYFDDFVNFFQHHGIKTIGVQENWDNLSSKAFIDCNPDIFCVWGEQSAGHLTNVHSLFDTKIVITGSPRMQPYYLPKNEYKCFQSVPENLSEKIVSPYILFTGTGDGLDDEFILSEIFESLGGIGNLQLVYRPHPVVRRPISQEVIKEFALNGLIVDDHESSRGVFYHVGLVMNAELIINQFSTMLVEALLCNKKILLPGFISRRVKFDYIDACKSWDHFIGISAFPNVFISSSRENFKIDLINALTSEYEDSSKCANWLSAKIDVSEKFLEALK